ncbi:MAG: anhydro-N-acetylmuramic acid kinase [Planctomycetota bacterium]|jgi:anhydro-N-acetylmuramic acid kinase
MHKSEHKSEQARNSLSSVAGRLQDGSAVVAGVLSGTSVDGIDVALVRFPAIGEGQSLGAPELLHFATQPFPEPLGSELRDFIADRDSARRGPREVALLHRDLGLAFGEAAAASARSAGIALDLVGSHGQTVWHHDGVESAGPMTLQLGDGDHVAAAAEATTVSDFRTADIAAGGEGAPLSALVDDVLFPDLRRPGVILNLGGIANLTILGPRSTAGVSPLLAFDVGPAGALLDGLARARLGQAMDRGGGVAASGEASEDLVRLLMAHPFLDLEPPKTTGRDTFGENFLGEVLAHGNGLSSKDLLASGARFVGLSILAAIERWGSTWTGTDMPGKVPDSGGRPTQLVVAGGGVHHGPLMATLAEGFGGRVSSTGDLGVDPDAREALCFAVLAARCVRGEPSTMPGASGAVAGRILGKVSPWH